MTRPSYEQMQLDGRTDQMKASVLIVFVKNRWASKD